MLFLNADGTVKSQQKISDTEGNFTAGLNYGDSFGYSLTNLGDLDGDGLAELAVGANRDDGGGIDRGAVYVLFLNADGTVKSHQRISDGEGVPVDLADTFLLNSNPGAAHTIFLDFDGHTTSGTNWNSSYTGGADIVTPAYDFEGDASSFTDAELTQIQWIWQRVAEDYMPFDVNVTTQDPGAEALIKTSQKGGGKNKPPADTEWGVRIVIGGSSSDWYGSAAGGVGYLGSFDGRATHRRLSLRKQVGKRASLKPSAMKPGTRSGCRMTAGSALTQSITVAREAGPRVGRRSWG